MKTAKISLNSIDKVKAFVNEISKFDWNFDLVSGRYVIDAKSIMGIFSLDLSKPINLNVHAEGSNLDEVLKVLAPYIIDWVWIFKSGVCLQQAPFLYLLFVTAQVLNSY